MRIKVQAHTSDEEGTHYPGEILDMRDGTAEQWILRKWAVRLPEEKKEPEPEPKKAKPELAVIETPEDNSEASERETATIRHRGEKSKKK